MKPVTTFTAFSLFITCYVLLGIAPAAAQCSGGVSLTVDPAVPAGGYDAGTQVTFTLTVGSYSQVAYNWFHGVAVEHGSAWDQASLIALQPSFPCSAEGYWAWYDSVSADGSGLVLGPGFYFDANNPIVGADGNPGNNYGDENANGFCYWTFTWQITAATNNAQPNGIVTVYGDGTSGQWSNSACGGDVYNIASLVANTGCSASFAMSGSAFANWPLTFSLAPPSFAWDSVRWWINGGEAVSGLTIDHVFDTPGQHTVCLATYAAACADTLCAPLNVQPNPYPFGASLKIMGYVYYDENKDGVRQLTESGAQLQLRLDSANLVGYPDPVTGRFAFYSEPGVFVLKAAHPSFYITTELPSSYSFAAGYHFIGDIGVATDSTFAAAEVFITNLRTNCALGTEATLVVRNAGTSAVSGDVKIAFTKNGTDPLTPILNDTVATIANDTLYLTVENLGPFQVRSYVVELPALPGTSDTMQWSVAYDLTADTAALSDQYTSKTVVVCDVPAIQKAVLPLNDLDNNQTLRNTVLHYTLAAIYPNAQRVAFLDSLPASLDTTSIFIWAEHLFEAQRRNGVLQLNLPEAVFTTTERHSVSYRVNHSNGLPHNTRIENYADVFIDAQPSVRSDTAVVTIVDSLELPVAMGALWNRGIISLFPNPATSEVILQINWPESSSLNQSIVIEIADMPGRVHARFQPRYPATQLVLDLSPYPAGLYHVTASNDGWGTQRFKLMIAR